AAGGQPLEIGEVDAEAEPSGGIGGVEARDAAIDQEAAEGHNEGLQADLGDQQAMDDAHDEADGEHGDPGQRPGNGPVGDEIDENDAEQRDHRADRQLDAAGDDDEALPDGEDAEKSDEVGGVGDVDGGEEARIDQRDHRSHHDDQDQKPQILFQ